MHSLNPYSPAIQWIGWRKQKCRSPRFQSENPIRFSHVFTRFRGARGLSPFFTPSGAQSPLRYSVLLGELVLLGYIWVNFITTEPCSPETLESWLIRGIIPFYGPTIQVSEIWFHLPKNPRVFTISLSTISPIKFTQKNMGGPPTQMMTFDDLVKRWRFPGRTMGFTRPGIRIWGILTMDFYGGFMVI